MEDKKSRFAMLIEERNVDPKVLRLLVNRFTFWSHYRGIRTPKPQTAVLYCKALNMRLDKFYRYLNAEETAIPTSGPPSTAVVPGPRPETGA